MLARFTIRSFSLALLFGAALALHAAPGTLSVSTAPIAPGAVINLTAEGALDWVHWGLDADASLDRKASVSHKISNFTVLYNTNTSYRVAYRYADNYNGYSWSDGFPTESATNTPTGVYVLRPFAATDVNGFQFTVPAGTTANTLKVYLGTFAARGKFQVTLSDNSAPAYTDTSLNNTNAATNAVYAVTFAAASAGQTLTIRWTVNTPVIGNNFQANVTLQAATLTAPGADNPPYTIITSPAENAAYFAPADITLDARAFDPDGTMTNLAFYASATKLGEVAGANVTNASFTWFGAPPGDHWLTVRATDNSGTTSSSAPVEVFVNGSGGYLAGSAAAPPASVDLTAEGAVDWTQWASLSPTNLNRKSGVTARISDFTQLGANALQRLSDSIVTYSWNDGTPVLATNSTTGVFLYGLTNGFQLSVPADTNARTLKVYVSLYGAQGNFQAFLSDFSAPAFTDTSVADVNLDNAYVVYSVDFATASAGQTLTVRWTARNLYDWIYGNVALQAATLSGGPLPPSAVMTSPPNGALFPAFTNITLAADASAPGGSVAKVEFFENATKLGETATSPYGLGWSNVPAGAYALTARVTDNNGAAFTSLPVNVSVLSVGFTNLVFAAGSAGFSLATQSNLNYAVEFTDSLSPANWQFLTNFTGTGNVMSVMDTNAPVPERYYHVIVQ